MICVTQMLQEDIVDEMIRFDFVQKECKDIYDAYWKTDANTIVGGLSNDSDPATKESQLSKKNYIDGITLCENLNKFFTNNSPIQADYLQSIDQVQYGNTPASSPLSVATEEIGMRIKLICLECLELYKNAKDIVSTYYDSQTSAHAAAVSSDIVISGSDMIQSELIAAIVMLEQFKNFITNNSITGSLYSSTISKWRRFMDNI